MSGETNRLLKLARQISELPDERELDVIASTGEQVSVGLVALAIQAAGCARCRISSTSSSSPG
jgi:aspartate kinase